MGTDKSNLRPPNLAARGKKKHQSPVKSDIPKDKKEPPAISINSDDLMRFKKDAKKDYNNTVSKYKSLGYNIEKGAGDELCVTKIPTSPLVTVELSPKDWVFGEADTVASWNTEDNGLTLTKNSLDYINKKAEGIRTPDLVKNYDSFIGAWIFKNHVQKEEESKGLILDATLRTIEIGKRTIKDEQEKEVEEEETIFYTRCLLAVNRQDDEPLSNAFEKGKIQYGSMGNLYFNKQCSYCGKLGMKTKEIDTRCIHMKLAVGQWVDTAYGKRRIVEWWSPLDNEGIERFIQFYEYSLLTLDPAFNGSRVWRQQKVNVIKQDTPIQIQVEEKYLQKEAFKKYIEKGQIKIINKKQGETK